jgi:hypothetical protein
MSTLIDLLEQTLADLDSAGVRATMDPRNLNPPGVLVVPPEFDLDVGCGGTGNFSAFVVAPGPANLDAWRALDALAAQTATAIPVERIRATFYTPDDTSRLPALELTWTRALSWP